MDLQLELPRPVMPALGLTLISCYSKIVCVLINVVINESSTGPDWIQERLRSS